VQYASGLKIDFSLWPVALLERAAAAPALPQELDAGYRVLLDKDGLTAGMRAPTGRAYVPRRPTDELYQTVINDFLSDAPYVAKCLWRDELLPAKWCLDHDMKHKYLRQVLEWRLQIEGGWSVPVGALGKGLKKRLPPRLWDRLERCYAGGRLTDNWAALFQTLSLFRDVAVEVGEHLGYEYPDGLHREVCAYVERIGQLGRRPP
jgi:aminoglycoside 6-adenylyltransferase